MSSGYGTARTHSDLTPLLCEIRLHILQSHQSTLSLGDGDKIATEHIELSVPCSYCNYLERLAVQSVNILLGNTIVHFCGLIMKCIRCTMAADITYATPDVFHHSVELPNIFLRLKPTKAKVDLSIIHSSSVAQT